MTLLSPLAPSSAPLPSSPTDRGGAPNGRAYGPALPAVERARGLRDALQDHSRQARGHRDKAPQTGAQDQKTQGLRTRDIALRRERDAETRRAEPRFSPTRAAGPQPGGSASAPFLAQVFDQDLGQHQVFIPEHRDAAVRGSEAYRQAGAAPPVYSEEPALFRFAI